MEMVCPICKATFTLTDAENKRGRKKTCSRECSYALRGLQGRSRVTVNCAKCGCVLSKTPSQVYGASYCDGCKSDRVQPFPVGHRCHGWTVISAEAVKEAKVYWQKCRCECGREQLVRKVQLNPAAVNSTKGCVSCGRKKTLTVLSEEAIKSALQDGCNTYSALGRELGVDASTAKKNVSGLKIQLPEHFGDHRSKRKDIPVGTRFGDWTTVAPRFKRKGYRYVTCRCKCGQVSDQKVNHLLCGETSSCRKCMGAKARGDDSPHKRGIQGFPRAVFNKYKGGARQRGMRWELTEEDMLHAFEKTGGQCPLSGLKITLPERDYDRKDGCAAHWKGNASLDRIDPSQGYLLENIQWVERSINMMKRDYTQEDFINLCCLVDSPVPVEQMPPSVLEERILGGVWDKAKLEGPYSPHWTGYKGITGQTIASLLNGAKSRGYSFDVTAKQLWDKFLRQYGCCAMTGQPLSLKLKQKTGVEKTASADRIDSSKPYNIRNVWWLHSFVNMMKRDFPLSLVRERCHSVAAHNNAIFSQPMFDSMSQRIRFGVRKRRV